MGRMIKLNVVRHPAPAHPDYSDLGQVVTFERSMRVHRAHQEAFEVMSAERRVDSTWHVRGESSVTYHVDLMDRSGLHDVCDCPDFLSNQLGTCKHLEAVRRAVASRKDLAAAFARLPQEPRVPTLAARMGDYLDLAAIGLWPSGLGEQVGLKVSPAGIRRVRGRPWPAPGIHTLPGGSQVRITYGAAALALRIDNRAAMCQRREAFLSALAEKRLGLDVLRTPLFPYQEVGVRHLVAQGRALLSDDMGLGKTVQAIAACEVLRRRGEARTILVVTPASLKDQWAREIERHAGARAVVLGKGMEDRTTALNSDAPYKILNYELTHRELSRLRDLDADVLILDEAQRAKNFRTRTATTLRAIPSRFLFVLSGTPVENRLDDLYALLQLADPEVLGPLWRFNFDFHIQNAKGRVTGCRNLSRLRDRVASMVLRRRKEEVLDQLPAITEQTRYTMLSREQRELEESYRSSAAQLLAIAERRALTPAQQKQLQGALLKARQACNALELCDPSRKKQASPKLDEFEALVTEIASEGSVKILVFSEWVEMLKLAAARLERQGIGWSMLTGEIPTEKRPALLDRFREDSAIQVLLCSDAGGSGLNLQVASYVIHLDLPWNPARLDQRNGRAHRLGQTRGVSVTYLCAQDGIERGIEGTLSGKRAVRSAALDPGSDVEELEAQGFSLVLTQLRESMTFAEESVAVDIETEVVMTPALDLNAPPRVEPQTDAISTLPHGTYPRSTPIRQRPDQRLKLARIMLSAGFPEDALKAAYQALVGALTAKVDDPPPAGHAELVGLLYRDLLPNGRAPLATAGLLAKLHDLCGLDAQGIALPESLVSAAIEETEAAVTDLGRTSCIPSPPDRK
jgi:superfamily II DNA or RNA helicase